ncbi:hypothetical protein MCOR27_007409 [Pyricularia oryzae]|uniref:DNA repair protein REV1 n=2 Tax=Pyricularia TaxID=48558 RepID=A0ABQ8P019_PYRGI|nr:hypothetical protein MCOR01_007621 [Pyricularia oryzae]KAI6304589.1 hypothetical protein MCOR33_000442 [Pyricularia grisea]KAI6262587.1 hypothetical protein MCOR19_001284 [Pyricularia oryzae]KAI6268910.1 hypothetical protein MCOR26_008964 [Pyricularia oryzae]KAI6274441.1 hypothetical protein MCOR27_007409 [Pyricularia oryzae]
MGDRLEKNSAAVRKRIEDHTFTDETGEEYEASAFGGFGDYFRRKKIKLQNLDAELRANASPGKPQIFKGVVAHVMGYTQPSLQVLHKELVQHGAGFLQYLDSKTCATHIIASALPPKKVVDYNKYRMVKPQWVIDSISAGKLLPWTDYRVFDEGPAQKTLKFDNGKMSAEKSQQSNLGYREQTQNSLYTKQLQKQAELHSTAGSSPFRFMGSANQSSSTPLGSDYSARSKTSKLAMPLHDDLDEMSEATHDRATTPTSPTPAGKENIKESSREGSLPVVNVKNTPIAPPVPRPKDPENPRREGDEARGDPKSMTSEEHNALLLKDPKIWKSSTANPDFLKQFYSESRLHHLSTWKAELKSKMQKMAAEKGTAQRPIKRKPGSRRYIMHVDFDSFFCAVSLKSAPEYIDKPAVVAHGNGTGSEIASCNYPAREFGVKNGMWMKRALELCPTIKVLPYDFPAYEDASRLFYEAILEIGGIVQSVSVDEALIDITTLVLEASSSSGVGVDEGSVWREQEKANELAADLRAEIKRRTGCNVSIGMGPNILMAKVALRKAKPAGQYQVKPEEILDILSGLKVEDLPGVAYSIKNKLEEVGVRLVKDVRELSRGRLTTILGPKTGERLWEYSRGIDKAEVGDQPMRKSVSAEVNWGIRFVSQPEAEEFVMNLCKELEKRLLSEGVKGKGFTMKIMRRSLDSPLDPPKHLGHGKCDVFNKSVAFGIATYSADFIGKEAVSILRSYNFAPGDLRGLGVHLSRLEPVKGPAAGVPESSQKTLSFGAFARASSSKKPKQEIIEDDGRTSGRRSSGHEMQDDPISVDPLTPRKPKASPMHPAVALTMAREADTQARTPLNVYGTQFIMPTQPDPEVMAALPHDIRTKLMAQQKKVAPAAAREGSPASRPRSRIQSPALRDDEIPSDIDPEVFAGLPEDMKAEVLASYSRRGGGGGGQTVLPQSPRKDRVINRPRPRTTPTKRGGIRGMLGRARERQHDAEAGLQQTNLFAAQRRDEEEVLDAAKSAQPGHNIATEPEEVLDQEVLAALPLEVRREIMAEQRRRRLAQQGSIDVQAPQPRRREAVRSEGAVDSQERLQFPKKPARASFTKQNLTSLPKIKDMLQLWHRDTVRTGPHLRDTEVLETYLLKVIREERNLEKAQVLVAWLDWLVEEEEEGDSSGKGKKQWQAAVERIKRVVQEALAERGLGPMDLG